MHFNLLFNIPKILFMRLTKLNSYEPRPIFDFMKFRVQI